MTCESAAMGEAASGSCLGMTNKALVCSVVLLFSMVLEWKLMNVEF